MSSKNKTTSHGAQSGMKPAILGGTPSIRGDMNIAGEWPVVSEWSRKKVIEMMDGVGVGLRSQRFTMEFEKAFAEYMGSAYCLSMTNGTAAIRTAK